MYNREANRRYRAKHRARIRAYKRAVYQREHPLQVMKCAICGTDITGRSDKRYCSRSCRKKAAYRRSTFRQHVPCRYCGATFESIRGARFCSTKCRAAFNEDRDRRGKLEWYRRHRSERAAYLKAFREVVLRRLGLTCARCGTSVLPVRKLHLHHVNHDGEADRIIHKKNLRLMYARWAALPDEELRRTVAILCATCHRRHHVARHQEEQQA